MHISAPKNLQYESLWQEITTSKQNGKTEVKNIMKNTYGAFFTTWNLKSAVTYKCRQLVLSCKSVYFVISKFILLFSHSFHVPCILLSSLYFYIVRSMFAFLFNWSQSKESVVNQMSHLFFETQKYFFALFNFLKMVIFTMLLWRRSTLWNSTLKIKTLLRRCLTLLISILK